MRANENYEKYYNITKSEIGRGDFNIIYKAITKDSKEERAIKIIYKKGIKDILTEMYNNNPSDDDMKSYINDFLYEYEFMKKVIGDDDDNTNIVKYYEYFNTEDKLAVVMELCDENMRNYLTKIKDDNERNEILYQINNALKIIVKKKVFLGDFTLENILLQYQNKEKTKYIIKLKLNPNSKNIKFLHKFCSTNYYNEFDAPEEEKNDYNEKSDLWKIGIIIYFIYFNKYPFNKDNQKKIKQINNNDLYKNKDSEFKDLINRLLDEDPKKRLSWNEYFKHPFFSKRNKENFENYYIKKNLITKSGYAYIYKGINKTTDEKRAIKIFDKTGVASDYKRNNLTEITDEELSKYFDKFINKIKNMKIMDEKLIKKKNIVKFYEHFQKKEEIAIIMELCDDNLLNILFKENKGYETNEIYDILTNLNNSFDTLSKVKLIHRAINLENILIKYKDDKKKDYIVKLKLTEDSILLKDLDKNKEFNKEKANLKFVAPEILKKQDYNQKCDLWSLGVLIYTLKHNGYPFKGNSEEEILKEIEKGINEDDSPLGKLIKELLIPDPQKRLDWDQYFNHEFFISFRKKKNYEDYYDILIKIGETTFATVYKGKEKRTGEDRAIKVFNKEGVRADLIRQYIQDKDDEMKKLTEYFKNEINNMTIMNKNKENENIVKLYEYFDSKKEFIIIYELCDTNLLDNLAKREDPFKPKEIFEILKQLNNSFRIMYENKLVHRAINLENILIKYLDNKENKYLYKLKLTDDSILLKDLPKNKLFRKTNTNIRYIAPEILKGEEYNEKCDLWSLGVIIYTLAHKKYPFTGKEESEMKSSIRENKLLIKTDNQGLNNLLEGLLKKDPKERFNWEDYFNHPFIKNKNINIKDKYQKEKKIGESEFAIIYKGKNIINNEKVAIKLFNSENIRQKYIREFLEEISEDEINKKKLLFKNEIINMKKMKNEKNEENENIVKLIEDYEEEGEIGIIMELCDDNLLNIVVKEKGSFNSKQIKNILNQLNKSFKIMSVQKIVHRALNLENILIKYKDEKKKDFIVKLKLTEDSILLKNLSKNLRFDKTKSNIRYIAPEILKGEEYNEKCDLWSLGVIIYTLAYKKNPFDGKGESEMISSIREKKLSIKTDNPELNNLLEGLLKKDPKERFNWKQYFEHPFFQSEKK